jgi:hypothetical protein
VRARYKVVGNHIIDTWGGGVIVGELASERGTKVAQPRRRWSKRVQAQVMQDFILAAGVVLGAWLSYVVMP